MRVRARAIFAAALLTALASAGACSSGHTAQNGATPSGTASTLRAATGAYSPSAHAVASSNTIAACAPASRDVATSIGSGLAKPATSITDVVSVATSQKERQSAGAEMIIAARIAGAGGVIGTWAYSGDSITALNTAARKYSNWGTAAQAGSVAAKERAEMLHYPETSKAALCAARGSGAGPTASIGVNRCGPALPDVIEWVQDPGLPATAQELGGYDLSNCARTASQAELKRTSPQGAGYCTIVASLSANPHYNFAAAPAPKPRGILAQVGGAC